MATMNPPCHMAHPTNGRQPIASAVPALLEVLNDRDTTVRWGIAAGLSVPLSAYLEKL